MGFRGVLIARGDWVRKRLLSSSFMNWRGLLRGGLWRAEREEKMDGEDEDAAAVDEEAAGVEGPSRRKGVLLPQALTGVVNGEDCVESCCAVVVRVGYLWTDSSELEL